MKKPKPFQKGWQNSHVHACFAEFYIPKISCGELCFRSASKLNNKLNALLCCLKHDADRFLLGWLFLHRRLRSRQRGLRYCPKAIIKRHRLRSGCTFRKASFVFIRTTFFWKNPKNFQKSQSLSASIQGVNNNWKISAYLLFSNRCVTAPLAYPCTGQTPVSNFDYEWILHPIFPESSRKYFRFLTFFASEILQICGKVLRSPVENFVENFTSNFIKPFKYWARIWSAKICLCKSWKFARKLFSKRIFFWRIFCFIENSYPFSKNTPKF